MASHVAAAMSDMDLNKEPKSYADGNGIGHGHVDAEVARTTLSDVASGEVTGNIDGLKRSLSNRQVQVLAIGGSIGTALFVSIGGGLYKAGPASLLLGYIAYSCVVGLVNNCIAEMATRHPVSGGFIPMAAKWCDEALGFTAGWNFFLYEALLIPFEITAATGVLSFWSDHIPAGAICAACIVLYA